MSHVTFFYIKTKHSTTIEKFKLDGSGRAIMGKPANKSKSFKVERKMSSKNQNKKRHSSKKKKANNLNKKIKSLFNELREKSSLESTNSTVICLDDTLTAINKRKLTTLDMSPGISKKRKLTDGTSSSIINDNKVASDSFQCSTPLKGKSSPSLNNLNVSAIYNAHCDRDISAMSQMDPKDFVTIDLTVADSLSRVSQPATVIDLDKESQDCIIVSASNTSLSGESDVTVLNRVHSKASEERKIRRFANGIASLDPMSKGKLLELITQKIFTGCDIPKKLKDNLNQAKESQETVEDSYIKEIILGQKPSRNSIGSNVYNPERDAKKTGLRMIVIDGSNVAMEHGRGRTFSVKGLKICIDYFLNRGHSVKAFVPRFRCKFGKSSDPRLLDSLERQGLVVYTPSREVQGKMITSYDDRYIIQCAAEFDGVVVSGDNYRDLLQENPRWRRVIEQRLLPFTWVQDMIMFPRDPLGRNGPTLDQFLKHTPPTSTTNLQTVIE